MEPVLLATLIVTGLNLLGTCFVAIKSCNFKSACCSMEVLTGEGVEEEE